MTDFILDLKPSKIFATILLLTHIGAVLLLWVLALPWLLKLLFSVVIVIGLMAALKKYFLLNSVAAINVLGNQNGKWWLKTTTQELMNVKEVKHYFCSEYLVIINFQVFDRWRTIPLVLFKDAIPKDSWRKLRLLLRYN